MKPSGYRQNADGRARYLSTVRVGAVRSRPVTALQRLGDDQTLDQPGRLGVLQVAGHTARRSRSRTP